jgi:hypothetical protein
LKRPCVPQPKVLYNNYSTYRVQRLLLLGGERGRQFDFTVTEAPLADEIAAKEGWTAAWVPPPLARYPLVLGL